MERKKEPMPTMDFTGSVEAVYYKILSPDDFERLDVNHTTIQMMNIAHRFRDDKLWKEYDILTEGGKYPYNSVLSVRSTELDNTGHVGFSWLGEYEESHGSIRSAQCTKVDLAYLVMQQIFGNPNDKLMEKLIEWGKQNGKDTKMQELPWEYCFKINPKLYEPLKDLVVKPHQFELWMNKPSDIYQV